MSVSHHAWFSIVARTLLLLSLGVLCVYPRFDVWSILSVLLGLPAAYVIGAWLRPRVARRNRAALLWLGFAALWIGLLLFVRNQ